MLSNYGTGELKWTTTDWKERHLIGQTNQRTLDMVPVAAQLRSGITTTRFTYCWNSFCWSRTREQIPFVFYPPFFMQNCLKTKQKSYMKIEFHDFPVCLFFIEIRNRLLYSCLINLFSMCDARIFKKQYCCYDGVLQFLVLKATPASYFTRENSLNDT